MGGLQGLGDGDLAARDAQQIARGFRRHYQPFQPLLGERVFDRFLVFENFGIRHFNASSAFAKTDIL